MVFRSVTEALVLIFPTLYALTGGLLLQWYLGYNFSVAVWVGYIALFGIAVETGVVMVVYLHEALDRRLAAGFALKRTDIEQAAIEGAVQRLRPKLMTVAAVLASLAPLLWATGAGSDVMKPIAATDCRWHDHLDDQRAASGSGVFRDDEGTRDAGGRASKPKRR
jgi:copper/silver efflux system protein